MSSIGIVLNYVYKYPFTCIKNSISPNIYPAVNNFIVTGFFFSK